MRFKGLLAIVLTISLIVFGIVSTGFCDEFVLDKNEGIETTYNPINNPNIHLDRFKVLDGKAYFEIEHITVASDIWQEAFLLKQMGITEVIIYINSGGGSTYEAYTYIDVFEDLKRNGVHITAYAHGIVASAAIPIFLCANKRVSSRYTIFLIHPSYTWAYGLVIDTLETLKSKATFMKMGQNIYTNMLVRYSKITKEEAMELTSTDNWFNHKQAKEWGMIDEYLDGKE